MMMMMMMETMTRETDDGVEDARKEPVSRTERRLTMALSSFCDVETSSQILRSFCQTLYTHQRCVDKSKQTQWILAKGGSRC